MNEIQQRIYPQLIALIDACLPECRPRREFIIDWKAKGIDFAYQTWRNNFRIKNPEYLPTLESLIIEAKQYNVTPH